MEKLPSLLTTYERVFNLYFRTFIDVLPMLLIAALLQYGIRYYTPVAGSLLAPLLWLVYFFISLALYVFLITYIHNKHLGLQMGIFQALGQGISRFFPYLLSIIILMIPFALISVLLIIPEMIIASGIISPGVEVKFVLGGIYVIALVLTLIYSLYLLYFFVSGVIIVSQKQAAITGLKTSRQITKSRWWATFLLLLVYMLFVLIVSVILQLFLNELIAQAIVTIIFSSLIVSLSIYQQPLLHLVSKSTASQIV